MPHLELPRVTSDSSATTRHWLALCISALCPGKKGFIFPASPPSIYSPGGWAPCCFLFSGQRRGMWAGKLKSHLWHLEARPHPTLTRQKLYFDCVFCSQIPFIFWLCFFIDLWTPGGLGIVFHSQISYYKERSVCQEKPKKWGILKTGFAAASSASTLSSASSSASPHFEHKSVHSPRDMQIVWLYLIRVWARDIPQAGISYAL